MPTFKYQGRALVGIAGIQNPLQLTKVLDTYDEELGPLRVSRGTIHFHTDRRIPPGLVKKIVKDRIQEIDAGEG
jgi:uncharacterized protein YdhG (YjbR/CyaY superfamily)